MDFWKKFGQISAVRYKWKYRNSHNRTPNIYFAIEEWVENSTPKSEIFLLRRIKMEQIWIDIKIAENLSSLKNNYWQKYEHQKKFELFDTNIHEKILLKKHYQ